MYPNINSSRRATRGLGENQSTKRSRVMSKTCRKETTKLALCKTLAEPLKMYGQFEIGK